jgi:hypothetical protein
MSLVGALPLVKVARGTRGWLQDMVLYSGAGLITSSGIGAAIGVAGLLVLPASPAAATTLLLTVVGYVVFRELAFPRLPLPQWRRQTSELWGKTLPPSLAAALWGLDLGLVFSTYLTFAGPWLVAAMAFVGRDPSFGASAFATFWLGRAATVWFAAATLGGQGIPPWEISAAIIDRRKAFSRINALAAGLLGVQVVAFSLLGRSLLPL